MALLNKEVISVQPKNMVITAGKVTLVNNGAAYTIFGSVQPVGASVLQRLEEGARKSARYVVYTEGPSKPFDILPARPGTAPRLTTSKGLLIPIAEIDFSNSGPGAVLPNCAYACAVKSSDEPVT